MLAPSSNIGKMPAKQQQLSVDPADGKAYSFDSFLECYGKGEGQRRWATARQQPAYTGISLSHVCVVCVSIMVSFCQPVSLALGLFLPVSLESSFLPGPRSLALHVAPYCLSRCHATLSFLVCVRVESCIQHSRSF